MRYIVDFKDDEHVIDHYLCKQKQTLKTRSGKNYLSLKLQDKTGLIDAKVWELNNDIQSFEENDFIKIDGVVGVYQNELQLRINKIRKSNEGEYNPVDFIPCTDKDITSLHKQLLDLIESINNIYIKQLLKNIFINNEKIAENIKSHSAAKQMHHNYMGGLIEHSVSVAQICDFLSRRYKYVNRDILISGALLHDVGKVYELTPFPENDYTDEGELLGHIVIGVELITKEAKSIEDFPEEVLMILKHCIVSHHGELEFGSPQKPKLIEAFIIHCVDDMDAKEKIYEDMIEKDNTKGKWVGYHRMLGRNIRKTDI